MQSILLFHAFATCCMTGLIWFVQIVHYPLFAQVGREAFLQYETLHQQRTTWVVAPLMIVELVTALWLLRFDGTASQVLMIRAGAVMVLMLWVSTAFVQVPQHNALQQAWSVEMVSRLVSGNRIRTALWTVRGVMALLLLSGPSQRSIESGVLIGNG